MVKNKYLSSECKLHIALKKRSTFKETIELEIKLANCPVTKNENKFKCNSLYALQEHHFIYVHKLMKG